MKTAVIIAAIYILTAGWVSAETGAQRPGLLLDNAVKVVESNLTDLAGKTAIGAGGQGIGVRHWYSNTNGTDLNFGFSYLKDYSFIEVGGAIVHILSRSKNLNFLSLFGITYTGTNDNRAAVEIQSSALTFSVGIGVEYFFAELPNLSFSAFSTGINAGTEDTSIAGVSSTATRIATTPGLGLSIRYYLK